MKIRSVIGVVILLSYLSLCAKTRTVVSADNNYVLENENVRIVASGDKEFLLKNYVCANHEMLPESGSTTHPWQMVYLGPKGENPTLMPRWGEYKGIEFGEYNGKPAICASWNMVLKDTPEWQVRMYVSLGDDDDLPEWNIEAQLPQGWVITETEFPRLLLKRPDDAKAILPVAYGTEYELGTETQLQTRYPSCTGGMQLMLVHSPEGTCYISSLDTEGCGKIMRLKCEGSNMLFTQSVTTSYGWSDNGEFKLPWSVVVGYNNSDWVSTALKWYRPWALSTVWGQKSLRDRNIVKWVENADVWIRPADVSAETMEAVRAALAFYGKGVGLHWYYWHNYPFDTKYPEYFPAKPEFKEMVAETRKLGGHVTPYINGRLWDPASDSYARDGGALASCRKPDGSLYTEVYGSKVLNTVTCPASDIWQNKLRCINREILDSLSTDGVYMDQVGCASSEPCYADNHNHAKGGGSWWPKAYRDLLLDMRTNIYDNTKAMTTEENAEPYMDLFDMMLVVNSPHNNYTKMVPLFPLIYSDRCVYSGFTYVPWRIYDGSVLYMTMRSLLWGAQLGWINPIHLMADNAVREATFIKTLAKFRKANHDIFFGGRFMGEFVPKGDNPIVDVPGFQQQPSVMGALWRSVSGHEYYVVVNMSAESRCVELPNGKAYTVKSLDVLKIKK